MKALNETTEGKMIKKKTSSRESSVHVSGAGGHLALHLGRPTGTRNCQMLQIFRRKEPWVACLLLITLLASVTNYSDGSSPASDQIFRKAVVLKDS